MLCVYVAKTTEAVIGKSAIELVNCRNMSYVILCLIVVLDRMIFKTWLEVKSTGCIYEYLQLGSKLKTDEQDILMEDQSKECYKKCRNTRNGYGVIDVLLAFLVQ